MKRARAVLDTAAPELAHAVDTGLPAVSKAAAGLAREPVAFQKAVVERLAAGDKPTEAVRQTRKQFLPDKGSSGKYRVIQAYADPPWL